MMNARMFSGNDRDDVTQVVERIRVDRASGEAKSKRGRCWDGLIHNKREQDEAHEGERHMRKLEGRIGFDIKYKHRNGKEKRPSLCEDGNGSSIRCTTWDSSKIRPQGSPPSSVHVMVPLDICASKAEEKSHLNDYEKDRLKSGDCEYNEKSNHRFNFFNGLSSSYFDNDPLRQNACHVCDNDRYRLSEVNTVFSGYHSSGCASDRAESLESRKLLLSNSRHQLSPHAAPFCLHTLGTAAHHKRLDSRGSIVSSLGHGISIDRQSIGSGASMSANASVSSLTGEKLHPVSTHGIPPHHARGLGRGPGSNTSACSRTEDLNDPYEDMRRSGHGLHENSGMSMALSVTGESRFPHALNMMYSNYGSEAAKSDIATVCSGSVMDEMEVASVLSSEMNQGTTGSTGGAGSCVGTGGTSSWILFPSQGGGRELTCALYTDSTSSSQGPGGSQLAVDFALGTYTNLGLHNEDARECQMVNSTRIAPDVIRGLGTLNDMGPPLSRVLVAQCLGSGSATPHSHASSIGATSDHRATSNFENDHDEISGGKVDHESFVRDRYAPMSPSKHFSSQPNSPLQVDNQVLDLESRGTCPSPGKLEAMSDGMMDNPTDRVERALQIDEVAPGEPPGLKQVASLREVLQINGSGRRSPGGTVYKGRGIRRYQGRYMHLPLKRFHQNSTGNGLQEDFHTFLNNDHGDPPAMHFYEENAFGHQSPASGRLRSGSWSRSRSRSPSPTCESPHSRSRSRSPRRRRNTTIPRHQESRHTRRSRCRAKTGNHTTTDIDVRGRYNFSSQEMRRNSYRTRESSVTRRRSFSKDSAQHCTHASRQSNKSWSVRY